MDRPDPKLCPKYHHAVEIIGRRWNGAILSIMLGGATRFTDIKQAIPDLSDKMLSERLKELETEHLITRTVTPQTPVRIEYHLTQKGHALQQPIQSISQWANNWVTLEEPVT